MSPPNIAADRIRIAHQRACFDARIAVGIGARQHQRAGAELDQVARARQRLPHREAIAGRRNIERPALRAPLQVARRLREALARHAQRAAVERQAARGIAQACILRHA
ncbi:hypothetical protein G6F22_021610 [Rhizopus arrhizus]|nr:hypothetical protein G6F22_021610 [Rhizopus arrhizus]